LRALAERIALLSGSGTAAASAAPLILVIDGDVGRTLGHILEDELRIARPVLSIDGIELRNFDYVDIGEVIRPADVIPIVVKSLIFAGAAAHQARGDVHYRPIMERNLQ
jgi:ethanolamine utilization protein EutA